MTTRPALAEKPTIIDRRHMSPFHPLIRACQPADLPAVAAIYAHHVTHLFCHIEYGIAPFIDPKLSCYAPSTFGVRVGATVKGVFNRVLHGICNNQCSQPELESEGNHTT